MADLPRPNRRMDAGSALRKPEKEDERVLDLAVNWLPFGGPPPEEIWVQFGVDPSRFWQRVQRVLTYHSVGATIGSVAAIKLYEQGRSYRRSASAIEEGC